MPAQSTPTARGRRAASNEEVMRRLTQSILAELRELREVNSQILQALTAAEEASDRYVTLAEASQMLGYKSCTAIYTLIQNKKVRSLKIGTKWHISVRDLTPFIRQSKAQVS